MTNTNGDLTPDQPNLDLNPKKEEVSGRLDQEIERLKTQINLAVIVLFIGFAGVFVAVGLFVAEAIYERNMSYNELLQKVDVIQAQVYVNHSN